MGINFTVQESSALYRLMAESSSDVIFKTDRDGFIVHGSPAIERLGVAVGGMLIGPHILDLIHPDCVAAIRTELDAAMTGRESGSWIECRLLTLKSRKERWYEIQFRALAEDDGQIYGVLGIMRSLEQRRALEEQVFAAAMTDPLTGLTNRKAFNAMLQHLVTEQTDGCLALFAIDHFRAINMKQGHTVGDEVLVAFAEFLRTVVRDNDIVSRVDGEKLGVLLLGATPAEAEALGRHVIATLSELGEAIRGDGVSVTASGGVARIAETLDSTIRRAEMALFLARSKGRGRLEVDCSGQPMLPN